MGSRAMANLNGSYILTITCPAKSGIVASVASFLTNNHCYISELAQYDDEKLGKFFLRAKFRFNEGVKGDIETVQRDFICLSEEFGMEWKIHSSENLMRVLIMVSKDDHCLGDLMYRHRKGEIDMEITAIVSNHLDLRAMAEREGIRFAYLPVTTETKVQQEAALMDIIGETQTDLVVLARYMQVLSNELCRKLLGRAINIHHSFLPGFKGGRPYHQAFERGVKLIGATAHYVTPELDEGPIIDQEVQRVDHTYSPQDLISAGRNTETVALSRAVMCHLEHRVFLNNNKTVVIR